MKHKPFLRNSFMVAIMLFVAHPVFAQKTNGTVRSLVNADEYFSHLLIKDGINYTFLKMSSVDGVIFNPNPINIKTHYNKQEANTSRLERKPTLAMIAKSGYFGFTSGSYTLQEGSNFNYGHYLSIWKADKNKKWQLALNADIKHPKPTDDVKLQFSDPDNYKYPKLIGPKKIKMREDIVFSTDLLLGKSLGNTRSKNFLEFYSDEVRLFFPGLLPLIGKSAALKFLADLNQSIISQPSAVDRAISGDLAYTYGTAQFGAKGYNYIRIWQIDTAMKWNIIVDMYVEL